LDDAIHLNQMEIYRLKVRKINFVENVLWWKFMKIYFSLHSEKSDKKMRKI
jgi:hypothetical protein